MIARSAIQSGRAALPCWRRDIPGNPRLESTAWEVNAANAPLPFLRAGYNDCQSNIFTGEREYGKIQKNLAANLPAQENCGTAAAVIAVLLGIGGIFGSYIVPLNERIQSMTVQYESLEDEYALLESDFDQLNTAYDTLSDERDALDQEITKYKDQQSTIDQLQSQVEEIQGENDELSEQNSTYKSQNEKLADEKKELEEQISSLQSQLASAKSVPASSSGSLSSGGSYADNSSNDLVWLSATGSKYHSIPNCGRMDPDRAYQVSRSDSEARGYGACSKCW